MNEKSSLDNQTIYDISHQLSTSVSKQSLFDQILLSLMGRLLIQRSAVFQVRDKHCISIYEKGFHEPIKLTCQFANLKMHEICNVDSFEFSETFKSIKIKYLYPIYFQEKLFGFFAFSAKMNHLELDESDQQFMRSVCEIAINALERSIIFENLHKTNHLLDQRVHELSTLMEIGARFNESLEIADILKALSLTLMGQLMISKHGVIYEFQGSMRLIFNKGLDLDESDIQTLCKITHVSGNQEAEFYQREMIRTVVPLYKQNRICGYILLGKKLNLQNYTEEELDFLKHIGNILSSALNNAILFIEAIEKQKLQDELDLAKQIQQNLLPKKMPENESFEVFASNKPSKQVGGDYFDFIHCKGDCIGIAIGDVSGKGASAALLMSNLQASMQALTLNINDGISDIISKANNIIYRNTSSDKYITFFYAEYYPETKEFEFVNAGHNFPLLLRDNQFSELRCGGIIIGMMPNMPYESEKIKLRAGDLLVFYTDGISEAPDEQGKEYETERLKQLILVHQNESAEKIHDAILKDVFDFSPNASDFDDITLIVLKILL